MTESTAPIAENASTSPAVRIGWAMLILATLYVCYFSHLGAIGFVGPDEPRYAWIARDMAETGDWVTPRLYGKPWFEKPVLYYWGAALCFRLFGVSEAAARLPSAVSALLATLALAWLALSLYGAETARWLLLLLPTTVGMVGFSHAAATDMPFSGMFTIAMVCAAVVLGLTRNQNTPILPHTPSLALILFGFFLGLAVLAKGPAAILLSGGAIFFWALFTKGWRDAFRLLHPAAIASFCLTALPWYILCARRNPDFFRVFIIEHNFKRYLTPEFHHIQPFWYYIPILLLALLPWSFTIASIGGDFRRAVGAGTLTFPSDIYFACWIAFVFLFFSASKSKLPGYVLPAIPAMGVFVSQSVSLRIRKTVQGQSWIGITSGIVLFALGVLIFLRPDSSRLTSPALAFMGGGLVTAVLGNLRRLSSSLVIAMLAILAAINLSLSGASVQAIDYSLSARSAIEAARITWSDYSPEQSTVFKLPRSFQYSLNFYFHREVPEWSPDWSAPRWVFASPEEEFQLRNRGLNCPFNTLRHPVIVCRNPGSADGANSGRQPH